MPIEKSDAPTPRRAWNTVAIQILAGLALGLGLGVLVAASDPGHLPAWLMIAEPLGRLWLNALTMTIVPLVFSLLATGLAAAATDVAAGGLAARASLWFLGMLIAASLVGALVATGVLTLFPVVAEGGLALGTTAAATAPAGPGDWVAGLIPTNPIKAAAETAMVPIVVFALFFGLAMTRIEPGLRASLTRALQGLAATMLVIVRWVLLAGPLGVLALAFGLGARLGVGAAGALAQYIAVVSAACLAVTALAYLAVAMAGRLSPLTFARAALPAQAVALGTQSSLATLPAMVQAAPALAVHPTSGAVVLPLAVSVFRAASAAANIAVAVYLAHLHGVHIGAAGLVLGAVTAAVVSLAAVGLPAQVSFFATIAPVCLVLGVPIQLLPVLLAVETIPDLFRTVGNVTWDLAVLRIVGRQDAIPSPQAAETPALV